MGSNKITGLANGTVSTDAVALGQLGTMATENANAVVITGGAIDATTIGATTPSSVKATGLTVTGATSGTLAIAATAVAGTNTATFPAATGTVMVSGNMPAFSAYLSATQTVTTNVVTKVTLDTKLFDTNNNFASSRFTPTVAGYYQINCMVQTLSAAQPVVFLYKNGSNYASNSIGISTVNGQVQVITVVYCNGSTDYIEMYAVTYGGTQFGNGQTATFMSGSLVRSA